MDFACQLGRYSESSAAIRRDLFSVSATELTRELGVSWRTAWRVGHKLMAEPESCRQLSGRVEIGDAYLGGERAGEPGQRGRGSPNKIPFVMAVSAVDDHKPHQVVIRCMPFSIRDWAGFGRIRHDLPIRSLPDGLPAFRALRDEVASHLAIVTGSGRAWRESLGDYAKKIADSVLVPDWSQSGLTRKLVRARQDYSPRRGSPYGPAPAARFGFAHASPSNLACLFVAGSKLGE